MAFVEVDGSIARLIRNCQKTLRELHHSLLKLPEDAQDASEGQRCGDEIGRLDMWDTETGASEGHLDHALRLSSRLRDGVVELLHDLTQLSVEGMACQTSLATCSRLRSLVGAITTRKLHPRECYDS